MVIFADINEFTYLQMPKEDYFNTRLLVCSGACVLLFLVAFNFLTISDASNESWLVASRLAFPKTTLLPQ